MMDNSLRMFVALALVGSSANAASEGFGTSRVSATAVSKATESTTAEAPSFDILSCPFGVFKEAYLGAFTAADRLGIMALEDEAIAACAKRQERVNLVLSQERELRELLAASQTEDALDAVQRARANTPSGEDDSASMVKGDGASEPSKDTETAEQEQSAPESSSDPFAMVEIVSGVDACAREYMVELSGHQRGGDGKFHWATLRSGLGEEYVIKAGDSLPGGWRISSVSPEVVLAVDPMGDTVPLPVAPVQSGSVIDSNFYYEITPVQAMAQSGAPEEASDDEASE
jgi:hypothetical protein